MKKLVLLAVLCAAVSSAAPVNLFAPASTCVGNICSSTIGLTTLTAGNTYDINWDFSNDPFVTQPIPIARVTFWLDVTGVNTGPIKLVLYTQGPTTLDVVVAQGSFNHAANSTFQGGDFEFPTLTAVIAPTGTFTTSLGWLTGISGGKLNSATVTIEAVPEPATWGLMGAGLLGLIGFARRRKSA